MADGFRPKRTNSMSSQRTAEERGDSAEEDQEPETTSVAAHFANDTVSATFTPRTNRHSTRKSRGIMENPFASVEDEDGTDLNVRRSASIRSQSTISYTPGISNRSDSSASSRIYARTHTPMGQGGPSHPYNMYHQDTHLARTLSNSTTSTIRPSFPPSSPTQRPAHPYNMYTQNVDADMDEDDDDNHIQHPQTHIPVGFPGMQQAPFNRRLEDDNVSLGAHSEQLPPYSEYPEDGAPTNIVLPQLQPSQSQQPSGLEPVHMHTPFGQRRPQSMSDDRTADENERLTITRDDAPANEHQTPKRWSEKSWKEKRRTKFFGIPFVWLVFLLIVIIVVFVVVVGTIAGLVRGAHNRAANRNPPSPPIVSASAQADQLGATTNTLLDASPISSSTSPAIPTGAFYLSLTEPQEVQSQCLTNSTQSGAWDCNMSDESSMAISVGYQPGTNRLGAWIYSTAHDGMISYGTMPPLSMWSPLQLVTDMDDTSAGPAFQFQVFYPKLVVASPSLFEADSDDAVSKRDEMHWSKDFSTRRQRVPTGDQPWFCYWNSTLLEGFIYIQQNVSANASVTTSWTASATATPLSSTSASSPLPSSPPTMTMTGSSVPTAYPSGSSTSSPLLGGQGFDPWKALTLYPYVVKLEERRIAGSPQPYCQKKQILDDYQVGDLPFTVMLDESDPGWRAYASSGLRVRSHFKHERTMVSGSCHCQWTSGSA